MRAKRRNRLLLIVGLVALCGVAIGLTLYALRSNINLFFSPVQIASGEAPVERQIRAGGMVKKGSVERSSEGLQVSFVITDYVDDVTVHYSGILPDLFREGQGVVVVGKLNDKQELNADQVLAKHDENYMPPEVAEALKRSGYEPEDYKKMATSGEAP
uniref:cytochrome c maturation protein CcmE n=1 Tax=Halomonas sp. TaxID=1486246 RepID=UPI00260FF701|nr:cytochrome c maturation protein CcmE [Halomonas sp.]